MNATPMWTGLLVLLIVGALALVCLGAIIWLIVRRPRGAETDLMACGRCGYSVRGVQSSTCPECGSNLRDVGIVRPTAAGGGAAWWIVLVGTLVFVLVVLLFCVGGFFFAGFSPSRVVPAPAPTTRPAANPVPVTEKESVESPAPQDAEP